MIAASVALVRRLHVLVESVGAVVDVAPAPLPASWDCSDRQDIDTSVISAPSMTIDVPET